MDVLDEDSRAGLECYVSPLRTSRGTAEQELHRQWLVAEWVLAEALSNCLDGLGAGELAAAVVEVSPLRSPAMLTDIRPVVDEALRRARDAHCSWRDAAAALAQSSSPEDERRPPWRPAPGTTDPRRASAWGGLVGGTQAAIETGRLLLAPASASLGLAQGRQEQAPPAWKATIEAFGHGVAALGWSGTYRLASSREWDWRTPSDEAWRAGEAAVMAALGAVRGRLQRSAHDLVRRLLAVTWRDGGGRPMRDVSFTGGGAVHAIGSRFPSRQVS